MKDLTSDLDDKVLKGLQHKIDEATAEASELKEKLAKKDEELAGLAKERDELNSKYKGKDKELESKVNELNNLNSEIFDLKKTVTLKVEEINALNAQVEDLTKKNEELTNFLTEKDTKIKELNDALAEKDNIINVQNTKIEEAETELTALKPTAPTTYTSEDRLMCPSCGAIGKDINQNVEDKTKVLSYVGHKPMYAKKNVCKKCGYEF